MLLLRLIRYITYLLLDSSISDPADAADANRKSDTLALRVAAHKDDEDETVVDRPAEVAAPATSLTPQGLLPENVLVIIDAGHGPATRGKQSPPLDDGTVMKEYEFNWAVGEHVVHLLRDVHLGKVVYTVDEWAERVGDLSLMGNALAFRVDVANEAWDAHRKVFGSKAAALFVSIHANAAPASTPHGWVPQASGMETWFYASSAAGQALAYDVHYATLTTVRHLYDLDDRGLKYRHDKQFYVLRNTHMPACLVECGFMTNPADLLALMRYDVRRAYAKGIVRGIFNHLEIDYHDHDRPTTA